MLLRLHGCCPSVMYRRCNHTADIFLAGWLYPRLHYTKISWLITGHCLTFSHLPCPWSGLISLVFEWKGWPISICMRIILSFHISIALIQPAQSAFFFIQPRITCLGMAPPTVIWVLINYQLRKYPHWLAYRPILQWHFFICGSLFLDNPVCVKLIKKQNKNKPNKENYIRQAVIETGKSWHHGLGCSI